MFSFYSRIFLRSQQNRGRKRIQNVYHSSVYENNEDVTETNANQVKHNKGSHIYSSLLFTILFYSLMPMICGCNQLATSVIDFACGNFTVANSVNKSEFQWLNFTIPIKNKSGITNTSGSSISSINQTCCQLSNEHGPVNTSKIFLLLSQNLTNKMHFDFCSGIPMQYALNTNKNFSIASVSNNTCNQQTNKTISLQSKLSCAEIQALYDIDKKSEKSFRELASVYDRFTYCYTDHDNDDLLNLQHCNKDCSSCLVRFCFMSSISKCS